jgi:GGDEF domain-containing protein
MQLPDHSKEQLNELVQRLAWNERYGCYTRAGLQHVVWETIVKDIQYVIFLDIDDMHTLNERYGYDGVDAIIKKSLQVRGSDFVCGQLGSGDELVIFITRNSNREQSDPVAMSQRVLEAFKRNGASATFGIAPLLSSNFDTAMKPAFDLVQVAKRENRRGTINIL